MRAARFVVSVILVAVLAPAQDLAGKEKALAANAAEVLMQFARLAQGSKMGKSAKRAYELLFEYDPDHRAARDAMGFQRISNEWRLSKKPPQWTDTPDPALRDKVAAAWAGTQKKLGALHRVLGLELVAIGDREHGERHLQRALQYDPEDAEAHQGLGHGQHEGFFGTPEEIAFVERLQLIERTGKELAARTWKVEPMPQDQLPAELKKSGLAFTGAKSERFRIWSRGDQAATDACVQWAERALALLRFLVGEERAAKLPFDRTLGYRWIAFTNTEEERDQVLRASPEIWQGEEWSVVRRFDDFIWPAKGNNQAAIIWRAPEMLHDRIVGFVFFQGLLFGRNEGLGEGLLHGGTWLLLGTMHTWYGSLPSTKGANDKLVKPSQGPWLAQLRQLIARGEDQPIQQVAREQRISYRPQVRIKSWWWMVWLMARYPDRWFEFFQRLSDQKQLMPEAVDGIGQEVFGRPLGEIEQEWRQWAAGDSPLARASGHGVEK